MNLLELIQQLLTDIGKLQAQANADGCTLDFEMVQIDLENKIETVKYFNANK